MHTEIINDSSVLRKCVYAVANENVHCIRGDKCMNIKDAVANRFSKICKERNIKVNELATLSGVTPSTVYSMMDTRRRDISIITIKKLCDGLEITLGEFFSAQEFDELEQEIK